MPWLNNDFGNNQEDAMTNTPSPKVMPVATWHRTLLLATAVFSILLIAMGGVLCVTHFIRTCPDWPGCFGRIVPPAETGPILEYTHRVLAALSGILILSSAIAGLVRTPKLRWLVIPPWISVLLVVEVSYFGAQVVLRGLSPGWAAVDVASALLVVALMVTSAIIVQTIVKAPEGSIKLDYSTSLGKMAVASTVVVYLVLLSGVLVAGNNSISGCLGWPVYSPQLFRADLHLLVKTLRWLLSIAGIVLMVMVMLQALRTKMHSPRVYRLAQWAGLIFLIEALIQVLLVVFDLPLFLLIGYTVLTAAFWGVWIALCIRIGLDTRPV
jgi:heme A synthase